MNKTTYKVGDLILIQFSAVWCVPCHRLKNLMNASKSIQLAMSTFLAGHFVIDVDTRTGHESTWVLKANVKALPTMVLYQYDDKGEWIEYSRIEGMANEQTIAKWLEQGN